MISFATASVRLPAVLAAAEPPARGAALHQIVVATVLAAVLGGVLVWVAFATHGGRIPVLHRPGWNAPLGGALVLVCGVIALAGFPLDDVWHALFGQDVTLWGPTHIQMIGGASLATLALWILVEEGRRHVTGRVPWFVRNRDILAGGAFLLGLSTLQGEFDFGVPQFRQLYHPVLLMLAAGIGLVAVRIRSGRGAAVLSVLFFLALRGALTVLIAPILGRSTLHFPLYLVE